MSAWTKNPVYGGSLSRLVFQEYIWDKWGTLGAFHLSRAPTSKNFMFLDGVHFEYGWIQEFNPNGSLPAPSSERDLSSYTGV